MKKISIILTTVLSAGLAGTTYAGVAGEEFNDASIKAKNAVKSVGEKILNRVDQFIVIAADEDKLNGGDLAHKDNLPGDADTVSVRVEGEVNGTPTIVYQFANDNRNGCARGMYVQAELHQQIGSSTQKVTDSNFLHGDVDPQSFFFKYRVCEGGTVSAAGGVISASDDSKTYSPCDSKTRAQSAEALTDSLLSAGKLLKGPGITCLHSAGAGAAANPMGQCTPGYIWEPMTQMCILS